MPSEGVAAASEPPPIDIRRSFDTARFRLTLSLSIVWLIIVGSYCLYSYREPTLLDLPSALDSPEYAACADHGEFLGLPPKPSAEIGKCREEAFDTLADREKITLRDRKGKLIIGNFAMTFLPPVAALGIALLWSDAVTGAGALIRHYFYWLKYGRGRR